MKRALCWVEVTWYATAAYEICVVSRKDRIPKVCASKYHQARAWGSYYANVLGCSAVYVGKDAKEREIR